MKLANQFEDKRLDDIQVKKGDPFGEFNLGSTIVMIFEAPKAMRFNIEQGMKIKYGELVGTVVPQAKRKD